MQKTRKLISMLLAVLMIFSMCTVGMISASALPEDAVIGDVENDASNIDGEVFGLMGDSDGNGKINVKDATQIQKFAAKITDLDEKSESLSDVDLNGKVNVKDATGIQKWVAKIEVDMPINCLVYIPTVETTVATEPTTEATEDETKPSVPVIVIPTTIATDPVETTTATDPVETTAATDPVDETEATDPTEETKATTEVPKSTSTDAPEDGVTIYFQNNWLWGDVRAYCWDGNGGLTEWPGEAMTFVENDGTYDIYSYTLPENITGFVISGTKDTDPSQRDQTPDILSGWYTGICYYMEWDASANEGAGGNAVNSFDYVIPTTTADTTAADTSATSEASDDEQITTSADDGMITVYFVKPADWANANIYAYYGSGTNATTIWTSEWPGDPMTFVEKDANGNDIYSAKVPADINVIKFGDGTKTSPNCRTDIIEVFEDGSCFKIGASFGTNKWYVENYDYTPGGEITTSVPGTSAADTSASDTTVNDDGTITIYFTNNQGWEVVNVHYWGASESTWPGVPMEFYKTTSHGFNNYKITLPAGTTGVVFNGKESAGSGKGNEYQTLNVEGADLVDGYGYYPDTQVTEAGNDYNKWIVGFWVEEDKTPEVSTTVSETTTAPNTTATSVASDDEATTAATTVATTTVATTTAETSTPENDKVVISLKASGTDTEWLYNSTDREAVLIDTATNTQYKMTLGTDGWTAEVPKTVTNITFQRIKSGSVTHTWLAGDRGTDVNYYIISNSIGHWESEPAPDVADVYLPGDFNTWNQSDPFLKTSDANVVTKTFELAAGTYKFKIMEGTTWYGNDGTITDTTTTSSASGWEMTTGAGDCTLVATGGKYVFNYYLNTHKLIVLYNSDAGETTTSVPDTSAADTSAADTSAADTSAADTSAADTSASDTTVPETYKVYVVNSYGWSEVAAYAWNEGGSAATAWPGFKMTKTDKQANGFDVYEYTFDKQYTNIIFNNNVSSGSKTADLDFVTDKYFDTKSAAWYDTLAEVPAPSKLGANVFLAGEFNGWNTAANELYFKADGDTVCYVEMDLAANTSYKFKVVTYNANNEIEWRGLKYTGTITDSVVDITCSRSAGDTTMTTKSAGKYIFAFDTVAYTIDITYPG